MNFLGAEIIYILIKNVGVGDLFHEFGPRAGLKNHAFCRLLSLVNTWDPKLASKPEWFRFDSGYLANPNLAPAPVDNVSGPYLCSIEKVVFTPDLFIFKKRKKDGQREKEWEVRRLIRRSQCRSWNLAPASQNSKIDPFPAPANNLFVFQLQLPQKIVDSDSDTVAFFAPFRNWAQEWARSWIQWEDHDLRII